MIYESIGDYLQALTFYEDALEIFQELEDRDGEGIAPNNIGIIYVI